MARLSRTAALQLPIQKLGIANRFYFKLARDGINTIGKLVAMNEYEILDIRGIDTGGLDNIRQCLAAFSAKHGVTLKLKHDI